MDDVYVGVKRKNNKVNVGDRVTIKRSMLKWLVDHIEESYGSLKVNRYEKYKNHTDLELHNKYVQEEQHMKESRSDKRCILTSFNSKNTKLRGRVIGYGADENRKGKSYILVEYKNKNGKGSQFFSEQDLYKC